MCFNILMLNNIEKNKNKYGVIVNSLFLIRNYSANLTISLKTS